MEAREAVLVLEKELKKRLIIASLVTLLNFISKSRSSILSEIGNPDGENSKL